VSESRRQGNGSGAAGGVAAGGGSDGLKKRCRNE